MVTRVAKHEFARLLRGVEGHLIAHATSHFLNCLLGDAKACSTGFDLNELTEDGTVHYPLKSDLANGHGPHHDATSANKGSKKKKGKKGAKGKKVGHLTEAFSTSVCMHPCSGFCTHAKENPI